MTSRCSSHFQYTVKQLRTGDNVGFKWTCDMLLLVQLSGIVCLAARRQSRCHTGLIVDIHGSDNVSTKEKMILFIEKSSHFTSAHVGIHPCASWMRVTWCIDECQLATCKSEYQGTSLEIECNSSLLIAARHITKVIRVVPLSL